MSGLRGEPSRPFFLHAIVSIFAAFFVLSPPEILAEEPASPSRPHVILIVIDALRADRLGVYGNPDRHSPHMDEFASTGSVFEEAIAQAPWTQPSIASLFCSQYPGVHKVLDYNQMVDATYFGAKKVAVLGDSFITLAEALQSYDYETAAFVANPFLQKAYGFAQGFDRYEDRFASTSTPGDIVNRAVLEWLESRTGVRPFFLYLHYMDVHGPYNASPQVLDPLLDLVEALPEKRKLSPEEIQKLDYLRKPPEDHTDPERHVRLMRYREYWEARYNACVREMDRHFNSLAEGLRGLGVWEDSLIVLTADHGEELFEHGYWDHGHSLHHKALHVPLILRWKDKVEPAGRVSQRVRLFDLAPTLYELLEIPHWLDLQGKSFAASVREATGFEESPAFSEAVKVGPEQKSVYEGTWKAIETAGIESAVLYRIDQDPLEKNDLSEAHPVELKALTATIAAQVEENENLSEGNVSEPVEVDPGTVERFQRVGYLR